MLRRVVAVPRILLVVSLAAYEVPAASWIDVPYVQQRENGCGSASLAMVIQYWQARGGPSGANADVESIQRELYVPTKKGVPTPAMQEYLEREGFRTFVFGGEWADLEHHVAAGRPLIVGFRTSASTFHYAVVAGISDDAVMLNDPADRKLRRYGRTSFWKQWSATGRWTLLAVPGPAATAAAHPK